MAAKKSNPEKQKKSDTTKPQKPYRDYPLFAHANGQWAKKIGYKMHYFGPWSDPHSAVKKYIETRNYLFAGQTPPQCMDGITLDELVNRFLFQKRKMVATGELSERTYRDYIEAGTLLLDKMGRMRPVDGIKAFDFYPIRDAIAERFESLVVRKNWIIRVRTFFKWAYDTELIDKPIKTGDVLELPSQKNMRQAAAKIQPGSKSFTADEILKMLEKCDDINFRAMILLGINCGFANNDCSELREEHFVSKNVTTGWHIMPRPKTWIPRKAKLWPETIEALTAVLAARPACQLRDDGRVFITRQKNEYLRLTTKQRTDSIAAAYTRLSKLAEISGKMGGFKLLRHTCSTIIQRHVDLRHARDMIMGHTPGYLLQDGVNKEMALVYRDDFPQETLIATADHLHQWLFGK